MQSHGVYYRIYKINNRNRGAFVTLNLTVKDCDILDLVM